MQCPKCAEPTVHVGGNAGLVGDQCPACGWERWAVADPVFPWQGPVPDYAYAVYWASPSGPTTAELAVLRRIIPGLDVLALGTLRKHVTGRACWDLGPARGIDVEGLRDAATKGGLRLERRIKHPGEPDKCVACGEDIFTATPGVTTSDAIREFADRSKHPLREEMLRTGWIHPGEYCPNGCHSSLHSRRIDWEDFKREGEARREPVRRLEPAMCDPDEDGWITCPGCGIRWTLRDPRFVTGPDTWEHGCGRRIVKRA
jgi:hypothetical protein